MPNETYGWYHPAIGYWETEGMPPEHIANAYPPDYVSFPLRPDADHQLLNGQWVYVEPTVDPVPEPISVLYPVHLWERMTKVEADQVGAVMDQQDFRTRKIFESASSYRSDHELWPLLQQIATQLFGAPRAAQILAPSELVAASSA